MLSWSTSNATSVTISGVGAVGRSGATLVSPFTSTFYTLWARGPNGTATGTASVTILPKAPAASVTVLPKAPAASIPYSNRLPSAAKP